MKSALVVLFCLIVVSSAQYGFWVKDSMLKNAAYSPNGPSESNENDDGQVVIGNFLDLYRYFSGMQIEWWKGPNVCIEQEETEPGNIADLTVGSGSQMHITAEKCSQTSNKYECVTKETINGVSKSKTILYQCCQGYRLGRSQKCEKSDLLSLVETIERLNGSEFLTLAKDFEDELNTGNFTVFLPTDEVFKDFAIEILQELTLDVPAARRRRRHVEHISTSELMRAHVSPSKSSDDVCIDTLYHSLLNKSVLQVSYLLSDDNNFLVNCAKVLSSNNFATNGVVHTVDRVLLPVTRTIAQTISDTPNLSIFNTLLKKTGLSTILDGSETFTVFAPTDAAFDKLSPAVLSKIMNSVGTGCVTNILKHYMVSAIVCSEDVKLSEEFKLRNVLEDILDFTVPKPEDNNRVEIKLDDIAFFVDKIAVLQTDIVATNGVIHIIDEIKIPNSAMSITAMLQKNKLTKVYDAIVKAGMVDEINNLSNVTFFVPTDKALNEYSFKELMPEDERIVELADNNDNLRSIILHHISKGSLATCAMTQNLMVKSLDEDKDLRINMYKIGPQVLNMYDFASVNCAKILDSDTQQCDNMLHEIDRPLSYISGNIMDMIKAKSELSTLNKIIENTEIERILSAHSHLTFVAPTNEAFKKLTKSQNESLLANKETFFKQYISFGVYCCTGLRRIWPFKTSLTTYDGETVEIGEKKIGSITITECDYSASNGVMHLTNKITMKSK